MRKINLLLTFLLCISIQLAYAQERTITGTVTDQADEPLPGVNVKVANTTIGTITNADGTYAIEVPANAKTLVFSFVGKKTKRIPIGDKEEINVVMEDKEMGLEEVVVVGYGTKKKRDITGSVSSVSDEEIEEIASASVEGVLQGRTSGLQMTKSGGAPGSQSRILIRGLNSISSGTEPLIIIDGMPVPGGHTSASGDKMATNPMSLVNPSDIESIQVLKDAAATAIYGSRGSNGVILIQTKSGEAGKGELSVDYKTGISNPNNMYDFVDTQKWLELADEARANNPNDLDPFDPTTEYNFYDEEQTLTRSEIENINTDWFDKIMRQGSFTDLNVSASGGSEEMQYYLSGNYRNDQGFLKGNDFDRIVARTNIDAQPIPSLRAGMRWNFTYMKKTEVPVGGGAAGGNENIADGNWQQAVGGAVPWLPVYNEQGNFFDVLSGNNLAATLYRDYHTAWSRNVRTLGKVFADYTLPFFKDLTIHSEFSLDYMKSSSLLNGQAEIRPNDKSYGSDNEAENYNYNYNVYGTYQKTFSEDHNVKVVAGAESLQKRSRNQFIEVYGTTAKDEEVGRPAGESVQRVDYKKGYETRFRSYFGRMSYNFQQRYYFEFSIRRDGSSVFGNENLFGTFPAASVGWVISDEPFMSGMGAMNFLKLRGSYGKTGNSDLSGNPTVDYFSTWKRYGEVPVGYYLATLGSQQLTWETTNSFDAGFDYGFFDNRINGSFAVYNQDISRMILNANIPESAGVGSVAANIGDLRNWGVEFSINSVNIDRGNFMWRTNFNISFNRNKILELTPTIAENNSGMRVGMTNSRIDQRIGTYFMAKSAGINEDTGYEMIYAVDNEKFLTNDDGEYVDQNGNVVGDENRVENPHYLQTFTDSIIPATEANVSNNRALLEGKTGMPTYYGGLSNTFRYKGLSLSATFNFQGGNYIYDNVMEARTTVTGVGNISKQIEGNYWTPNNTDAKYPKLSWNNQYEVDGEARKFSNETTNYLYKADYIRLGTVRLAYELPDNLLKQLNMNNVKIYVAGHNLWTYAPHYPGLDPAVTSFSGSEQERNLQPGIVGGTFLPKMRRFNVGVNLTF
jgi:TonB-linked SusC/RagA family outer membrane protein